MNLAPTATWHSVNEHPPANATVVCLLDDGEEVKGRFLETIYCGGDFVGYEWALEDSTTTNRVVAWRYL